VAIIGAGPAGLMLAHLLNRAGIECIVLENRSREHCQARVRAGLIEQWARDLLVETGVGECLKREGLFHKGTKLQFGGELHPINFMKLVGKGTTIYGQQEVVKDLIAAVANKGTKILFEASVTSVDSLNSTPPKVKFIHDGRHRLGQLEILLCQYSRRISRPKKMHQFLLAGFERKER